ncbi:metalloregulator ArsR/SmtB family transcription factor [Sorangium sp. So ce327]|uniref:ArsR/SmtB family transcription factor n=1 Tax=Sorangium sp. So ce327 TaxID=3133301 RepID=UPI003F5E1780
MRLTSPAHRGTGNPTVTYMSPAKADIDVFFVIADPTRRAILDRLRAGPAPVNEIAADFSQSRPAISKHLRVLKASRLVTEEKVGRERLYTLRPAPLQKAMAWLEGYRAFWGRNLESLKRYLEDT